jgi:hypothetical protein
LSWKASGRTLVSEDEMLFHSRLIRGIGLVVLVALAGFGVVDRVLALADSEKVLFGPLSVGRSEAVRVNVSAVGNPNEAPWTFVVRIFNRSGVTVGEHRLELAPGVTGSIDVNVGNPDIFPVERLGRRTLRAEIVGFNPQPDPPGAYAATLEIYSLRTGRTSILLGGPDTIPSAQP